VCIALCTIVAHNIAQNRPDSFPPYPPDDHHSSDDVYLREGGGLNQQKIKLLIKLLLRTGMSHSLYVNSAMPAATETVSS